MVSCFKTKFCQLCESALIDRPTIKNFAMFTELP